jgi:hypothetical protein
VQWEGGGYVPIARDMSRSPTLLPYPEARAVVTAALEAIEREKRGRSMKSPPRSLVRRAQEDLLNTLRCALETLRSTVARPNLPLKWPQAAAYKHVSQEQKEQHGSSHANHGKNE